MSSMLPSPIPSSTNTGCLCLIKSPSRIPPPEDPQLVRRPRSTVAITWLAIPSALVNVAVAPRFVTSRSFVLGVLLSATTAAGLWFATIMGKLGDSNVITDNLRRVLVDTDEAKDPFYVLLLGTDGRPGEDTYRADSIILARIDPTQKQATLIFIR